MNTIITWVQLHSAEVRTATTLSRAGIHLRQLNAFSFLTCDCCSEGNESLLENKSFLSRDGGTNISLLESLTHCSLLTTEKSHSSISFPNYRKPELSTHHKQYPAKFCPYILSCRACCPWSCSPEAPPQRLPCHHHF